MNACEVPWSGKARTSALTNRGSWLWMRSRGVLALFGPSTRSFEIRPCDPNSPDNLLTALAPLVLRARNLMQSLLWVLAPRGTWLLGESASDFELSSRGSSGDLAAFSTVHQRVLCTELLRHTPWKPLSNHVLWYSRTPGPLQLSGLRPRHSLGPDGVRVGFHLRYRKETLQNLSSPSNRYWLPPGDPARLLATSPFGRAGLYHRG